MILTRFSKALLLVVLTILVLSACGDNPATVGPLTTSPPPGIVSTLPAATPILPSPTTTTPNLPPTDTARPTATPIPSPTSGVTPSVAALLFQTQQTTQAIQTLPPTAPPTDTPAQTATVEVATPAVPVPTTLDPLRLATSESSPCAQGQLKANRNSGIYHAPGQRDYAKTKDNVQCYDNETQAQAAGYRKAKR